MRRLLTSRWIAGHLLAAAGIVAFVALGFWQLRRLDEKRDLNAAVEAAVESPVRPVETALASGEPYRRVVAEGTFDPGHEVLVLRSRSGVSGYHVLTPLLLDGGAGVLVDRGWVPPEFDTTPVAGAPPPAGRVRVEGLLWPAQAGAGDPPPELPTVVRGIDPALVEPFVAADLADPYLILEAPAGDGYPIPAGTPELSEGSHLSYAVQWFLFAVVVAVAYPLLLRRVAAGRSSSSRSRRSKTTRDPAS